MLLRCIESVEINTSRPSVVDSTVSRRSTWPQSSNFPVPPEFKTSVILQRQKTRMTDGVFRELKKSTIHLAVLMQDEATDRRTDEIAISISPVVE